MLKLEVIIVLPANIFICLAQKIMTVDPCHLRMLSIVEKLREPVSETLWLILLCRRLQSVLFGIWMTFVCDIRS